MLVLARVEAANGQGDAADARIARTLEQARSAHWVSLEIEARLAQIAIAAKPRQRALARALYEEASRRGFSHIAAKARLLAAQ
jgi:hypothetical protein